LQRTCLESVYNVRKEGGSERTRRKMIPFPNFISSVGIMFLANHNIIHVSSISHSCIQSRSACFISPCGFCKRTKW